MKEKTRREKKTSGPVAGYIRFFREEALISVGKIRRKLSKKFLLLLQ
jgi:hypothetical protein